MRKFVPDAIYYEEKAKEYELGKELLEKYKDISLKRNNFSFIFC